MSSFRCGATIPVRPRARVGRHGLAGISGIAALAVLSAAAAPARAAGTCCPVVTAPFPSSPPNEVIQVFEFRGKMHTAWKVRFAHATSKGLYISGAWFRRGPGKPWMKVLAELRLAELFVPYHPGEPRFYDMSGYSFDLIDMTPADVGCCGEILDRVVAKEVRSRGVVWKDETNVYMGHELVLWAAMDAANYNYLMEYRFRDDGSISFGFGATARNLTGEEWTPHMHLGLWRVDLDLNGPENERVSLVRHLESTSAPSAVDEIELFAGGREGSADWVPEEFTHLRIETTDLVNGRGNPVSYDLVAERFGNARHEESFSHADFWVSRYHAGEDRYTLLPSYVAGREVIDGQDVVVWTTTPIHHLPRDEDGIIVDDRLRGAALLMWSHATLRPRNLFDRTPFFIY